MTKLKDTYEDTNTRIILNQNIPDSLSILHYDDDSFNNLLRKKFVGIFPYNLIMELDFVLKTRNLNDSIKKL